MEFSIIDHLKNQPILIHALLLLGFFPLLKTTLSFIRWLYVAFLRPAKDLKLYGSWAVVTGPTDGIGKALAFRLAQKGLNLVLVGRNPSKLTQVSKTITAACSNSVETKTIVFDFDGDLNAGIDRLKEAVNGLDVGVLVNNAGTATTPYFFHELEEEVWRSIMKVNLEGATAVTQAILPGMLERRKGAIVNIGSGSAGVVPSFPLASVYAGTKGYINQFSRSLYVEYKSMGIDVQCQIPLYVATKLIPVKKSSLFIPSPEGYADAAMRWIGYEVRCIPYWSHSVQAWFASRCSEWVLDSMLYRKLTKERIKLMSKKKSS